MGNLRNIRGFAPLALLLYGSVIILTAFTGILGYKEYQLKKATLGMETTAPTTPTFSPIPTPTLKPIPVVQKTMAPGVPSRTGAIISYHEYCTNKDISIYQNELITKKSSDGKTYSMTQGDWNCYEKYLASKNSGSTNTANTYVPTNYYSCTLCYHYISGDNCSTFNYSYKTKAECDAEQASLDATYYPNKPKTTTTPAPTISPEQRQAAIDALAVQIQACWDSVNATYNQNVRNCNIRFGDNSAAQACAQIENQNRQRDLNACEGE